MNSKTRRKQAELERRTRLEARKEILRKMSHEELINLVIKTEDEILQYKINNSGEDW